MNSLNATHLVSPSVCYIAKHFLVLAGVKSPKVKFPVKRNANICTVYVDHKHIKVCRCLDKKFMNFFIDYL